LQASSELKEIKLDRVVLLNDLTDYQEPTTVFLLFDEPVAECWNDVEVEVVIDDVQSSEFCVKSVADWVNPYTYTFVAPGSCHHS